MDPDELYTLRAQFWLGHYQMCLDEGKAIARRPMSPHLKAEREEFVLRALLALGQYDKVISDSQGSDKSAAVQALGLQASYEKASASSDTSAQEEIIVKLKNLIAQPENVTSSLQLTAAHIFLRHDSVKDALQCVHLGTTMEHLATSLQIYLKIDRLDLANNQLSLLKQADEDATLTQLGMVYCGIAAGKTGASDALHALSMLSEQYGPSTLLLNMTAVAHLINGNLSGAENALMEAVQESGESVVDPDTYINLIVCCAQGGKDPSQFVQKMKASHASHPFVQGLERVEGAFERESVKYA